MRIPPRLATTLLAGALLAASGLTACDRGAGASTDIVRADSAGVQVITSGTRDTVLPWTFEEVGVFKDSVGEPYLFTSLTRHRVVADRAGRTYVLTRDPAIVRFTREGAQDESYGRRGGGPGEFQMPVALGAKGDTLWVMDWGKQALVQFGPDLKPAPDHRLEGMLSRGDVLYFRTGGLWFRRPAFSDSGMAIEAYADTVSPPLARVQSLPGKAVDYGCVQIQSMSPVFSPNLTMHATGARMLLNAQPSYELRLYEGPRLVGLIRRPVTPRAPTPDDVRLEYPDGMVVNFGGGRRPCVVPVERVMEVQGVAAVMPQVFDVTLLSDGSMWALRTPHSAPAVVDVFGPDGVYRGTMRGRGLPLARLPNGELLFVRPDEESGWQVIARMRIQP